jgi:IS1 family transposase
VRAGERPNFDVTYGSGSAWGCDSPARRQVVLKIAGVKHWLWRAVDQTGVMLDVLVQRRRDNQAAKRLLRKLLKKEMRPPRVVITDKLASYGAAKREVMPGHQPPRPARGKCRRRVAKDLSRYRRRAAASVRAGRGKRAALPREPPRASGDLTGTGCDGARFDGSSL